MRPARPYKFPLTFHVLLAISLRPIGGIKVKACFSGGMESGEFNDDQGEKPENFSVPVLIGNSFAIDIRYTVKTNVIKKKRWGQRDGCRALLNIPSLPLYMNISLLVRRLLLAFLPFRLKLVIPSSDRPSRRKPFNCYKRWTSRRNCSVTCQAVLPTSASS